MSAIEDAEWEANLCLTAFDILWAHVPREVLEEVEEQLGDNERKVIQLVAQKSFVRRTVDLPPEKEGGIS